MIEITAHSAADYLRRTGRVTAAEPVEVRELSGGVSNVVLLATLPGRGQRLVLKQARERLRVKEDWRCSVERIRREAEVLRICGQVLRQGPARNDDAASFAPCVPEVLWEDRENFAFAMTAAPPAHRTWKEILLARHSKLSNLVAATAGRLLGKLHAATWRSEALARQLNDRSFFERLRLDPYYRFTAGIHPDRAAELHALVESVWSHRLCLVHGDYSPKNLLVWPMQVMLIDCEVGHYGDPAFDLGFFLTHLVAKAVRGREQCNFYLHLIRVFWNSYRVELCTVASAGELADLERRMMLNLAGCLLARADGKSPLEYLADDERQAIRTLGREWLVNPPDHLTAED